jgi:hypothetical protein
MTFAIATAGLGVTACADAQGGHGNAASEERWDAANDPFWADGTFTSRIDKLPTSGAALRIPKPGHSWPTTDDSINARWDGAYSLSPAEKFERAFGKPGTALAVSMDTGIRGQTMRRECRSNWECRAEQDGSSCAIPRGASTGRCIPGWWGICHGWAHQAIHEPQAQRVVTRNGVTFYPADLDALMSLAYSRGLPVRFLSQRCNRNKNSGISVDGSGRVVQGECRDMNPGAFHLVIGNLMGLRQQSFVMDVSIDAQVWNHPVRDYRVAEIYEVSREQAANAVGDRTGQYTYNSEAERFFFVQMELRVMGGAPASRGIPDPERYTQVGRFEYVLETDSEGRIFGGEWVGRSKTFHPDFVWWAVGAPTGVNEQHPEGLAQGLITYAEIKALNDEAAGL